ncbi:type II toxin-antitoxin system RelE/ParE family toxin [bacterium]|nr:type II toxin-antitoxin system RelE/ParE family toxin [bacterium]
MSQPFLVRRAARRDMDEAREWYDLQQAGVGQEFLDETETVLTRIQGNPKLYAAGRHGVRQALVNRFPFVVIYRITTAATEIVAVMHTSRHPRAWRSRL